ncbi:MAG: zinc-binding alcohol dehydrogenase family protein [Anaeromyxobacteraceae bacterium]
MLGLWFEKTGSLAALAVRDDLPRPSPGPGEALVRVRAAGVNPSDPKGVLGRMAEMTAPRVPGRDFAGVVEEGPPEWLGREVLGSGGGLGFGRDGTHAEWVVVAADALVAKPASLSFEAAAGLGVPWVTAAAMVDAAHITAGDVVAIVGGTGAVAFAAAQLARRLGARVLATCRGAAPDAPGAVDAWLDLAPGADLPALVAAANGGRGADVVLDNVGGDLFEAADRALGRRGRHGVIASTPRRVSFDVIDFYPREGRLLGVDSLKLPAREGAALLAALMPAFGRGEYVAAPFDAVPLQRGPELYDAVLRGSAKRKIVLVP